MRHGLAAAIVAVGLLSGGCAGTPIDDQPVIVTKLDGYELQDSPTFAIEYSGNNSIFLGEVIGNGDPRKISRLTETGDQFTFVYTPIMVKVIDVFKGDLTLVGSTVPVRALGGQIGNERTVSTSSPEPGAYQSGMRIYFFTPGFLDAGDGLVATTPNFAYAEDTAGEVFSMLDPEQKAPAASFPTRISEYVGRHTS